MKPMATIAKTLGWVRADYPLAAPGGHIALVALCCRRPTEPHACR